MTELDRYIKADGGKGGGGLFPFTCAVRTLVHVDEGGGGLWCEAGMSGGSCHCLQASKDVYIIREALMGSNAE